MKKRKFLVKSMPSDVLVSSVTCCVPFESVSFSITFDGCFDFFKFEANFQDFNVIHNYLVSNSPNVQARIRKRGQAGKQLKCMKIMVLTC